MNTAAHVLLQRVNRISLLLTGLSENTIYGLLILCTGLFFGCMYWISFPAYYMPSVLAMFLLAGISYLLCFRLPFFANGYAVMIPMVLLSQAAFYSAGTETLRLDSPALVAILEQHYVKQVQLHKVRVLDNHHQLQTEYVPVVTDIWQAQRFITTCQRPFSAIKGVNEFTLLSADKEGVKIYRPFNSVLPSESFKAAAATFLHCILSHHDLRS